jgi:N-acetylglucosamine-6-phosphate deacetylase
VDTFWLTHGKLVTPRGIVPGALQVTGGRISAIRSAAPNGGRRVSVSGAYLAPGFIDLHIWGDPAVISREAAVAGCTAFLSAIGPEPAPKLLRRVAAKPAIAAKGAACLGYHLEGPFLNPQRAGALPKPWMRRPKKSELDKLGRAAGGRIKLITLAPELPGAAEAIRWCRQRGIVASMGHSVAQAGEALDAVEAGARAVTHVFNGMPPFHHRQPSLLDIALTDARLTTMVIFDGVHVSAHAFRLLYRTKGAAGVALVTDSIRHQGWKVSQRRGAYYTTRGVLAGSSLTMIRAVRNAVVSGGASLEDAVRMASETPARLLGLERERGSLAVGRRADLVAFDRSFRVGLTAVGGNIVY